MAHYSQTRRCADDFCGAALRNGAIAREAAGPVFLKYNSFIAAPAMNQKRFTGRLY